ncbi:ABC transporter permease [Pseudochelatococcus contaminans]|uniref:Peptide/nickel transport system permease protein n=1 Tax=Pseudochelatococcus contaminans TaxID=1538103 RepID=A0A7W5Z5R8_9HYPH|nr:ABC transporter permease [Pseudochelatococcus contaminans]MBB3810509.1 peptide/nickel transport system permease protein [Pseudochelatococcus contaminans]
MILTAFGRLLLQAVPVLFTVSLIVFILVFLAGDPTVMMIPDDATEADRLALVAAWGLDQPPHVQYLRYMSNILSGDFGTSYSYGTSALPIVLDRLPATLLLTAAAMVVAIAIAVPAGILAALNRNSAIDLAVSGASVLGKAMPNFWVGIMLILIFGVQLRLLPVSGSGTFAHLILPAVTLGTAFAADLAKLVRASMLETLGQDYIRTAYAKGIPDWIVIGKHALRNAAIPTVTMTSLNVIALLGGALVTETVFAWPGLGQLIVNAIYTKDMAVIQIAVFVITVMTLLVNFGTDIVYRLIDPRIRL